MSWITLKTTKGRWEAELMQQILTAYDIPCRVINIGAGIYCGQGNQAAIEVRAKDRWTALLLLSPPEDSQEVG